MKQEDPLRPRRDAKQQRSQELVSAILTAGVQLLESEGDDALTTVRIAERAGVSVGSLYRYFPNKESVVGAIYEAKIDGEIRSVRSKEDAMASFQVLCLRDAIPMFVEIAMDRHRRWLELAPEFYREHSTHFGLGQKMGRTEEMMRGVLEKHRAELRVKDLDLAAFIVARGLLSASLHTAVRERPAYLNSDSFARELTDVITAYLCGPE